MKKRNILRISITLVLVAIAFLLGRMLWTHYMDTPWTRDGRVRADVVDIASDVAGIVTEVAVHDNQFVHSGDLLFRIDELHYRNAMEEARAKLEQQRLMLQIKRDQAARRAAAGDQVVSKESRDDTKLMALSAKAEYDIALAQYEQARLNLDRTVIRAPTDGWVSNLLVRPGDFAQIGAAKLALIDQHSYWIYGYFEEQKLALMHVGDPAEIRLLGSDRMLRGRVESIAHGITDRDNPTDVRLLANVNPSFNWVRLAQRVPVRIRLDTVPSDIALVAGMTCSVVIKPSAKAERSARSPGAF